MRKINLLFFGIVLCMAFSWKFEAETLCRSMLREGLKYFPIGQLMKVVNSIVGISVGDLNLLVLSESNLSLI